jgi:hypothetical protein
MALPKEREMLKRANPDKKWGTKVDNMSASQVIDILARLKKQNKI